MVDKAGNLLLLLVDALLNFSQKCEVLIPFLINKFISQSFRASLRCGLFDEFLIVPLGGLLVNYVWLFSFKISLFTSAGLFLRWRRVIDNIVHSLFFLVHIDLLLKPNDKMFQLCNLLQIFPSQLLLMLRLMLILWQIGSVIIKSSKWVKLALIV